MPLPPETPPQSPARAAPTAPFKIKICGVRSLDDVHACADAGADCIGLNFFPPSVRYLDPTSPSTLELNRAAQHKQIYRVGLFVNDSLIHVRQVAQTLSLDAIQFHGDETVADIAELVSDGHGAIRAIRLPTSPMAPLEIQSHIQPYEGLDVTFLLDADAGAAFGGGGRQLHWPSIARWATEYASGLPGGWVLAGGLDSECVNEAIRSSTASSVDVASGVEKPRGLKSPELIQRFVAASRLGGVDETS